MTTTQTMMIPATLGPNDYVVRWSIAGSFGVSAEVHPSRESAVERAGALMSAGSHVTLLGVTQDAPASCWVDCR